MLSNGSLMVGLNEQGLVHDFYYPYIGLDNLTTARSVRHKVGVWVDGKFSWVDDGSWQITVDFESDALVSQIKMISNSMSLELEFSDFVDYEYNAFARHIVINNKTDHEREVRLFLHQAFQISRGGRADTALFVPEENYLLDYKGRCCLIIYGQSGPGKYFDQFAIGNYGIEGKEGTFKDAEDGELSQNPVEHGGVDSVVRFVTNVGANSKAKVNYWIIAADSQFNGEKIHQHILKDTLEIRLDNTRKYWLNWLDTAANKLHQLDSQYQPLTKKSLLIIKSHIDKRGGVIASGDSSIYNYGRDYYSYVWPRDGAFVLWPLIRLGYKEEPQKFFEFCRDILTHDGYLMHKYQPDRSIGSTWHPLLHGKHKELAIQEDETAIVLFMLSEYYNYTHDEDFVRSLYNTFIQPAANFLESFVDGLTGLPHASYDLWEEKFLTTTYTTATVYQALISAADFATAFEYPDDAISWTDAAKAVLSKSEVFYNPANKTFRKGFLLAEDSQIKFDDTIDISSLYGLMMFGLHDNRPERITDFAKVFEDQLLNKSPTGGMPRYQNDHYFASNPPYQGNPWFVATLWFAQYYIRIKDLDKAKELVKWAMDHTLSSGVMSEQVDPTNGQPVSVAPLVWSHAEFINTVLDLIETKNKSEARTMISEV